MYPQQDKNVVIRNLFPHYSSHNRKHFENGGDIAFGKEVKGMIVEYDDHLRQRDNESSERAYEVMESRRPNDIPKCRYSETAFYWEQWLSIYYGKPVTLHCIYNGVQRMNGYPWVAFGYTFE